MARSIEAAFPNITLWVQECGTVEIGYDSNTDSFLRAIDDGGMVWSGKSHYVNLDEALEDLEKGLGQVLAGITLGAEFSSKRKPTPKPLKPKKEPATRRKTPPEHPLITQVKKLDAIVEALRRKEDVPVTRLTVVKKLCENPKAAGSFAMFLAHKAQQRLRQKKGNERYRVLANRAVKELKSYLQNPTEECTVCLASVEMG